MNIKCVNCSSRLDFCRKEPQVETKSGEGETDVAKEAETSSPDKEFGCSADYFRDLAFDTISFEEPDELDARIDSSVAGEKRRSAQLGQQAAKRRKKLDEADGAEDEPGAHYAEAYFTKAKSTLDEATFQKFIAILSEAESENGGAVQLYHRLRSLLVDHKELVDDFVATLKPHQALEIGKLLQHKFICRSLAFLRQLEGCHLTKVIQVLEQISSNANLTYDLVKSAILPILRGHGPLVESFLHLLPNEKPPPPSSVDDYEDITEVMLETRDDGGWENVRIPEHSDRGCSFECSCRCHVTPSQPLCLSCNIRFIEGQAYVQYGKVIRYCKVHFADMSQDEVLQRFNPALYSKRRRKRKSISKSLSSHSDQDYPKDFDFMFQDENAVISREDVEPSSSPSRLEYKLDDDDDYWEDDDVSSGDKSSVGDMSEEMDRHSDDSVDSIKFVCQLNDPLSPLAVTIEGLDLEMALTDGHTPELSPAAVKASPVDLVPTNSTVAAVEQALPLQPEPVKVEESSEREATEVPEAVLSKIEESKGESAVGKPTALPVHLSSVKVEQMNVPSDGANVPKDSEAERTDWTRQEDKMILEAFQKKIGSEEIFAQIGDLMPTRSLDQIQGRFQVLMNLLERVAGGSHEPQPN